MNIFWIFFKTFILPSSRGIQIFVGIHSIYKLLSRLEGLAETSLNFKVLNNSFSFTDIEFYRFRTVSIKRCLAQENRFSNICLSYDFTVHNVNKKYLVIVNVYVLRLVTSIRPQKRVCGLMILTNHCFNNFFEIPLETIKQKMTKQIKTSRNRLVICWEILVTVTCEINELIF